MPDLPGFVAKEADAADALADAYRGDFVLLLLGSADEPYLSWRVEAQKILLENGYEAHVMETYASGPKGELLAQKWERLLGAERPTHFFIVVPKADPLRGPHVEFGYLMREYGIKELLDRVRFFLETGTDESKALAGYEAELIGLVGLDWFKDPTQLARRMARRVDNILYGLKR
ncbi:MAG: hypothetical protein WDA16_07800 [Candidatus Thermoplasmatota archaeon]